jgi:hypothetical protein
VVDNDNEKRGVASPEGPLLFGLISALTAFLNKRTLTVFQWVMRRAVQCLHGDDQKEPIT